MKHRAVALAVVAAILLAGCASTVHGTSLSAISSATSSAGSALTGSSASNGAIQPTGDGGGGVVTRTTTKSVSAAVTTTTPPPAFPGTVAAISLHTQDHGQGCGGLFCVYYRLDVTYTCTFPNPQSIEVLVIRNSSSKKYPEQASTVIKCDSTQHVVTFEAVVPDNNLWLSSETANVAVMLVLDKDTTKIFTFDNVPQ